MEKEYTCCICGKAFVGWGNNPDPITDDNGNLYPNDARCCDECNAKLVIPARLAQIYDSTNGRR